MRTHEIKEEKANTFHTLIDILDDCQWIVRGKEASEIQAKEEKTRCDLNVKKRQKKKTDNFNSGTALKRGNWKNHSEETGRTWCF